MINERYSSQKCQAAWEAFAQKGIKNYLADLAADFRNSRAILASNNSGNGEPLITPTGIATRVSRMITVGARLMDVSRRFGEAIPPESLIACQHDAYTLGINALLRTPATESVVRDEVLGKFLKGYKDTSPKIAGIQSGKTTGPTKPTTQESNTPR